MSRITSASLGTATWRAGLADPQLHWKRGRSAWELAVSWESRRLTESGLPPEVELALATSPQLAEAKLLLGIVEHSVRLDTDRTPSQNDLWCMLRTTSGLASVAIEGKAGEDFDKPLSAWLTTGRSGRPQRLAFLRETLGCESEPPGDLRYQLFHRTASAILEARRWGIDRAVMLVQSFAESRTSWEDFAAFGRYLGLATGRNCATPPRDTQGIDLHLAWVDSPQATDAQAGLAV